jgi:hypothetical protein
VAQQRSGHLTIEQLSALLDKQLSPQEWALCQAHLRTCQQCQGVLTDLQQTSVLLRALPQPALPRSFVLPATITSPAGQISRPETRATVTPITRGRRSAWPTYLRVSTRFISTIAAALGIFFLLSGLLLSLPHGGATTSASAPANAPSYSNTAGHGVAPTPNINTSHNTHPQKDTATRLLPTPTAGTGTSRSFNQQADNQGNVIPLFLDLSTVEGRMVIGVLLLILGILGVIFTRRRQVGRTSGRP